MKYFAYLLISIFLFSCTATRQFKKPVTEPLPTVQDTRQAKADEATLERIRITQRKPERNWHNPHQYTPTDTVIITPTPIPTTPTLSNGYTPLSMVVSDTTTGHFAVVLLDFTSGDPAHGLTAMSVPTSTVNAAVDRLGYRLLFANIIVTSDRTLYNRSDKSKSVIIYYGNSNGWNPGYGGMTYSLFSSDVYFDRFYGSGINGGECGAHEFGHSCLAQLVHHSTWVNGVKTEEYATVAPNGPSQMAYCYGNQPGYIFGSVNYSSTISQDDKKLIVAKYGLRPGQTL